MLGELGIVGLALLLVVLLGGAATGVGRLRRSEGEPRITTAALLAVLGAYAVAAGVDWMWELTIVSIVAFVCLALVAGPGTLPPVADSGPGRRRDRGRTPRLVVASIAIAAVLAIVSEGDRLLGQTKIDASQSATSRRDLRTAFANAIDARDLEPWAATPYLQIALVAEEQGDLATASQAIIESIDRDPDNWRLWLVRSRIETKRGMVGSGLRALRRARSLNPRSPLFASVR
jgi:hypothetical protein